MHKIVVLAALAVLLQAPAAMAKPAAIDDFLGPILASPAEPGIIKSRCDQMLAEADRRLNELELEHGAATIGRTLQRYDDLHKLLTDAGNEFTLYQQVSGDQERRDAGSDCVVRLTSEATKLSLSRRVYDRLKAIDGRRADPATRLYLTRTLQAFERAGVDQPLAKRAEIQALQEKIARASADFESNIAKGRKTVMADPAELAGLPPDFLRAHPPAPDGKITISTDYTDYIPVMAYAASSPLRRRLYLAFQTRAYPENDARLREILDWRQQLAMKLGRPNYAALALEDKMLDTPDKVERLIHDMAEAARPAAERDYARKLALLRTINPAASQIEPWDNSWLSQQVQKRDYAYDRQEARRYFAYDIVRNGILRLTEGLFGVEIRPWQTPVWDRSVEAYEMFDNGRLIGRFYFDSHPRPGKYSHANAISLRDGVAGRVVPLAALVMNLPAGGHATGLMEHDDVVTFLHEFGHLLHTIFGGQQRWQGQAGFSTEWDFVEAPSQMLENWVYDYDTLKAFAVDANGNPIPRELVEKMNKARYFDLGMGDMRQLGLSNVSLRYHLGSAPADLGAAFRAYQGQYDLIRPSPEVESQDSFGHLTGYSAFYYTYRWSKVIADDLYTRWEKAGLHDRATALAYRRDVLEPGGSRPAAELVASFLGRPISLDAYKAELTKAARE